MSSRYHQTTTNLPGEAIAQESDRGFVAGPLEVNVIFTDWQETAAALKFAQSFARGLGARISLRTAIAVPFQLPIDQPAVSVPFLQHVMRKLVAQLNREAFDPTVHLYLCRDLVWALSQVLKPNSLVVIGGRKRWWPTAETRMARALRDKGYRCFCRFESRVGFRAASFGTGDRSEVIMLLDIFYIGVAVVFFVVLWGFTKAAERL